MPLGNFVLVKLSFFCSNLLFLFLLSHLTENVGNFNCTTPDDHDGNCISLRQCKSLWSLLNKEQLTVADRKFLKSSHCGTDAKSPLVCCPEATKLPAPGVCGHQVNSAVIENGQSTDITDSPWLVIVFPLKHRLLWFFLLFFSFYFCFSG